MATPNQQSFAMVCRRVYCRGGGTVEYVEVCEREGSQWKAEVHMEWRIYEEIRIMLSFSLRNDYMRGTVHFGKKRKSNKAEEPEARLRWCGRVPRRSMPVEGC